MKWQDNCTNPWHGVDDAGRMRARLPRRLRDDRDVVDGARSRQRSALG